MNIRKTILQITVLHPADEDVASLDLAQILYQIDEGDWLGTSTIESVDDVPADKVRDESIALGNDGGFFFDMYEDGDDPEPTGKRIMAEFVPQAWVNDTTITVDPEGPTEWDVTDEILALDAGEMMRMQDDQYESDNLRFSKNAPQWVRDWTGPFLVRVEDAITEYVKDDESDD